MNLEDSSTLIQVPKPMKPDIESRAIPSNQVEVDPSDDLRERPVARVVQHPHRTKRRARRHTLHSDSVTRYRRARTGDVGAVAVPVRGGPALRAETAPGIDVQVRVRGIDTRIDNRDANAGVVATTRGRAALGVDAVDASRRRVCDAELAVWHDVVDPWIGEQS